MAKAKKKKARPKPKPAPKAKSRNRSPAKVAKKPTKKRKLENSKTPARSRLKGEKAKTRKRSVATAKSEKAKTRKREKARRVRKAPRGFQDVVRGQSPDEAYQDIKRRLELVRDGLASRGIDARVRIHRYADNSIDGEVLVKVPRGVSADDAVFAVEETMGRKSMPGFWINMGTRFTIKADEEIYRRIRGQNDVNTHYQKATPGNWSEIPLIVRHQIIAGMEKKYGRKADSVYLRIHWSPDGNKPASRG